MSESPDPNHDHDHNDEDEEIATTWTEGIHDLLLSTLTKSADKGSFDSLGVTLTVGGQTITGNLVGRAAYFDALLGMTTDETMTAIFEKLKEVFGEIPADQGPHFLHLTDVHLVSGSDVTEGFGGAWRVKIGDVNAWSFGILTRGPA